MFRKSFCVLLLMAIGLGAPASAATIYVDAGNSGDPLEDGSLVHPFDMIQEGIDEAVGGDEVIVSAGTYFEAITFNGKAIALRSASGPDVTIIDATAQNTSVVRCDTSETSATILEGFTLTNGTGKQQGVRLSGGGLLVSLANPTIIDCIFIGNTAQDGGGMWAFVSNPLVTQCVFTENVALQGGAVWTDFSSPTFTNCTMYNNSATLANRGGGLYVGANSAPFLVNCIVWQSVGGFFFSNSPEIDKPIVTYSNIEGGYEGLTNINADPQFADVSSDDLSIQSNSPCIDRGNSDSIAKKRCSDIAGDPRAVDDSAVPNMGSALFCLTVDMGAYEYQAGNGCVDTCPVDTDGDGLIDTDDFLNVLIGWGVCP